VGAFAYRAVFAGAVLPALPPFIKAENAPNENVPNYGDDRPSHLSQTSIASAGSSEEFASRLVSRHSGAAENGIDLSQPERLSAERPQILGGRADCARAGGSSARYISAPAGTGSGTRTVFLDAEEDPDGH
jgi:hypothetical protein